jgi:hypothetical protein
MMINVRRIWQNINGKMALSAANVLEKKDV